MRELLRCHRAVALSPELVQFVERSTPVWPESLEATAIRWSLEKFHSRTAAMATPDELTRLHAAHH